METIPTSKYNYGEHCGVCVLYVMYLCKERSKLNEVLHCKIQKGLLKALYATELTFND